MLSKDACGQALRSFFRKRPVVELEGLFDVLRTRSRMSVFRRLRELGYFSSYTHTGRYYTLTDIPEFDDYGLWCYEAIGFSRLGTLKATIVNRVQDAEAGCTHAEMEALLRLPVYNTLLRLVRAGAVRRETLDGHYVYVSVDARQGARQLNARRLQAAQVVGPPPLPADEVVLVVLVEALHASEGLAAPAVVAARLTARGEEVAAEQVKRVYEHFGLEPGEKTAAPR